MPDTSRCGFVAIIGRPNVGKSTLLNKIMGQKVSITARKPQTTRHQILGIQSIGPTQAIYVDTPGMHTRGKKALNKQLNQAALSAIYDVDVIILVVEGTKLLSDDHWILEKLKGKETPVVLVINKIDHVKNKNELIPHIHEISKKYHFTEIVPVSALTGNNVDRIEKVIAKFLPEGVHLFPDDQKTDRGDRFFTAEIIREKLTRFLGQEIPHSVAVSLEKFKEEKNILHISAVIWVEKEGQKKIVVGKDGAVLKKIGMLARQDLEQYLEKKIFLQLWVKVKTSWSDDERALQSLGYKEG